MLRLKLMKEAGFEGPEAAERQPALFAACRSGTAAPEDVQRAVGLYNTCQIGAAIVGLCPGIAQPSAGTLAGNALVEAVEPLRARLMSLHTTPGLVNAATVEDLKTNLGEFERLCREAAPDNPARPNALYFCGATAEALGDAAANLGDSPGALQWYARSGEFLDQAGDGENAGKSRHKAAALELRITGDIDRTTVDRPALHGEFRAACVGGKTTVCREFLVALRPPWVCRVRLSLRSRIASASAFVFESMTGEYNRHDTRALLSGLLPGILPDAANCRLSGAFRTS